MPVKIELGTPTDGGLVMVSGSITLPRLIAHGFAVVQLDRAKTGLLQPVSP